MNKYMDSPWRAFPRTNKNFRVKDGHLAKTADSCEDVAQFHSQHIPSIASHITIQLSRNGAWYDKIHVRFRLEEVRKIDGEDHVGFLQNIGNTRIER
jgi:hypothetical protein